MTLLALATSASAQVFDLRTGTELSEQALVEQLRTRDVVLLGELHDNPAHHSLRAKLITSLASPRRTVIAEHLPAAARVNRRSSTRSDLEAAGFDAGGWGWPLHQPLFDEILARELPLVGGNLPKGMSRQLMSRGEAALPDAVADAYRRSALSGDATKALDADLIDGHCGKLPDKYLPAMRMVQRATDASMATELLRHRPSLLVAGNGHVRKDYGVPQVLGALAPQLSLASVGFYERGGDHQQLLKSLANRYDFVWLTERVQRSDPCESFQLQ